MPVLTRVTLATHVRLKRPSRAHTRAVAARAATKRPSNESLSLGVVVGSLSVLVGPALADVAQSADAMPLTKNPAFLGFACIAVCWGIPQTLGTAVLAKKEQRGRDLLAERGIDTSGVERGNWGKIQRMLMDNDIDWRT